MLHERNPAHHKLCLLKVNKTFEELQILQDLNKAWKDVGPQIKNYMESSVEIQLLQVRLSSCRPARRQDEYLDPKISFLLVFLCFFSFPVCVTGFLEATRGGSSGQPGSGEHLLDSLTDRTFPVHTLTGCPKEPWSTVYLAGRPQ